MYMNSPMKKLCNKKKVTEILLICCRAEKGKIEVYFWTVIC